MYVVLAHDRHLTRRHRRQHRLTSPSPTSSLSQSHPQGLLKHVIIDTHFVTRNRMGRMVAFLARLWKEGLPAVRSSALLSMHCRLAYMHARSVLVHCSACTVVSHACMHAVIPHIGICTPIHSCTTPCHSRIGIDLSAHTFMLKRLYMCAHNHSRQTVHTAVHPIVIKHAHSTAR